MRGRWREQRGSFTLEASLVLPLLLAVVLLLLFTAAYSYRHAALYASAALAGQRAANHWDNSYKHAVNGSFPVHSYDGLYWRLLDDGIGGLFRLSKQKRAVVYEQALSLSELDEPHGKLRLPQRKMARSATYLPEDTHARLAYTNLLYDRVVEVQLLREPLWTASLESFQPAPLRAAVSYHVTDPVEMIRLVDLAVSFLPSIKNYKTESELDKLFAEFGDRLETDDRNRAFPNELAARKFLQQLTGGKQQTVALEGRKSRLIDALDAEGIAHQALNGYVGNKFTVQENGEKVNEQIEKDLALIRAGVVKGVVWHFFRHEKTGKIGPSKPLLRELEKSGIMVVIHD